MVLGLVAIAIIIFLLKMFWLPITQPSMHLQSQLTMQYEFTGSIKPKTEIHLALPYSTKENRVISQTLSYNGWRIIKRNYKEGVDRGITLISIDKKPSPITFQYYFSHIQPEKTTYSIKDEERNRYTKISDLEKQKSAKFITTLEKNLPNIKEKDPFPIDDFINQYTAYWGTFTAYSKLVNQPCSVWIQKQKNLFITLRSLNIPSRNVCGVAIDRLGNSYKRSWLEIYNGQAWQTLDVWSENTHKLFPLTKNLLEYSKLTHTKNIKEHIEFTEVQLEANNQFNIEKLYNLELLPIDVQDILKILLTLPFAILITAYLKTLFRIETYGNLTPALLGMALAFTDLLLSLTIMALIFLPTIFIRKLVSNKNKIVEHTVTLTFLILILIFIMTLSDMFNWLNNPTDVLLPVVVLALLIDKYFVNIKKQGNYPSNIKMFNTLMMSLLVVLILQFSFIGEQFLKHPELHLITIALAILLCKPYDSNQDNTEQKDRDISSENPDKIEPISNLDKTVDTKKTVK